MSSDAPPPDAVATTTTAKASNISDDNFIVMTSEEAASTNKRRKQLFGDCALVEIIHLHDCLRGAIRALHSDVDALAKTVQEGQRDMDLEKKVAGRFTVIWSVFRAHSQAEDQFIWPKLKEKAASINSSSNNSNSNSSPQQAEYEEDHADEDRMFRAVDELLSKLQKILGGESAATTTSSKEGDDNTPLQVVQNIRKGTRDLATHLMNHLEKEETQCLPLVVKYLSKSEIVELVGLIMGRRSADTIANIMTMAVQNLAVDDREEMIKYMKQSMAGTFFDQWLKMSGWMATTGKGMFYSDGSQEELLVEHQTLAETEDGAAVDESDKKRSADDETTDGEGEKRAKTDDSPTSPETENIVSTMLPMILNASNRQASPDTSTSPADLEKLIRIVASNPHLTTDQKNQTIQSLRDSVYRERERMRFEDVETTVVNNTSPTMKPSFSSQQPSTAVDGAVLGQHSASATRTRRVTPPSIYYKKTKEGKMIIWNGSDQPQQQPGETQSSLTTSSVPLFSAAELAPTYHDGAAGTELGCPHYSRRCKLRHPKSGRLYTCRLCCDQQRELPLRDAEEALDRYAVTEIMCMECTALQPASDRCINADCESRGKPFARYFCRICNLYDDSMRDIFHCPYCNICRLGKGLGVDFRHCMRCNACVSLSDLEHQCIPQKLQGDCPICHERLFQSTEPLRGLKCGHVMHMNCFTEYRRQSHNCPLCQRSMEEMSEYFMLLDNAIRMQPMPAAYLATMSSIYCQDCCKTAQVPYHFVGLKCPCGSFNTRELGRVTRDPST